MPEPTPEPEPEPTPEPAEPPTAPAPKQASDSAQQLPALVAQPQFRVKPSPIAYPRLARRQALQGEVLVEVWLDKHGKQLKRELLQSSGHDILDQAALKAIAKWRFAQHQIDGQPWAHRVRIPVRFNLD